MPRLIIVYNPRSSKHALVEKEVLEPARQMKGWMVGKYEVKPTDVDDNAAKLAQILKDGDLVVTAGGDGTATIGLNGAILSGKKIEIGVLGYGNFNDMARIGKCRTLEEIIEGRVQKIYPLEVLVDGRHWRYAACYVTCGLFAESTKIFDQEKTREKLRKKQGGLIFSVWSLAKWYFGNKRRSFLPKLSLNGVEVAKKTTDLIFVNSATMARLMKNRALVFEEKRFLQTTKRLGSLRRLIGFMMRSMLRLTGEEVERSEVELQSPGEIELQAEGEYKRIKVEKSVVVRKSEHPVLIRVKFKEKK